MPQLLHEPQSRGVKGGGELRAQIEDVPVPDHAAAAPTRLTSRLEGSNPDALSAQGVGSRQPRRTRTHNDDLHVFLPLRRPRNPRLPGSGVAGQADQGNQGMNLSREDRNRNSGSFSPSK